MKPKIIHIVLLLIVLSACNKKENLDIPPPESLGGENIPPTSIDQWILDSLTVPYNIAVKYRWDPWELALDRPLTPPDEDKILPAMSLVKRVWIDPYNAETGSEDFIKQYGPKQFKLVGSVLYNYNGTVNIGQAEGGNNIVFLDINQNFEADPVLSLKRLIQVTHHEFAHVLHMLKIYPQELRGVSAKLGMAGYTGTWFNVDDNTAYQNGYITPYAMSGPDDDFAEMVATMLMWGKKGFDDVVVMQNPLAQDAFRQKEQLIVDYFKDSWNIDFYSLQMRVFEALNTVTPPPAVNEVFGPENIYTTISVNPKYNPLLTHSTSFKEMYAAAVDSVSKLPQQYKLDSFQVINIDDTTAYLAFYLTQGTTPLYGLFGLDVVKLINGNYVYSVFGSDPIGTEIENAVLDILLYFHNRQFNISWLVNTNESIYPRVRFTPVGSANNYFIGLLVP